MDIFMSILPWHDSYHFLKRIFQYIISFFPLLPLTFTFHCEPKEDLLGMRYSTEIPCCRCPHQILEDCGWHKGSCLVFHGWNKICFHQCWWPGSLSSGVIFRRQEQLPASPHPQGPSKIKRCVANELLAVSSCHVPAVCGESPWGCVWHVDVWVPPPRDRAEAERRSQVPHTLEVSLPGLAPDGGRSTADF